MSPIGDMSAKADIFESMTPSAPFTVIQKFHLTESCHRGSPASRAHLIHRYAVPLPHLTEGHSESRGRLHVSRI